MSVIPLSPQHAYGGKEQRYVQTRDMEGRICSDDLARRLPQVPANHPHRREWSMRADSAARLLKLLQRQRVPRRVLDLGCGNGWLANCLAAQTPSEVHALDLNMLELEQGVRVFGTTPNLTFYYGDIFQPIFPARGFDLVVLASSVQYFPSLTALVIRLFEILDEGGCIHLLDSPFYPANQIEAARNRSLAYYTNLGVPEMASDYYHHGLEELMQFSPTFCFNPESLWSRIRTHFSRRPCSPFPWVRIDKPESS